ncbi:MAG: peroxiredoxin [Ignavibacteriales bacterium]|nr:peroxiredoxin [Ignavibacteriales bacterium]
MNSEGRHSFPLIGEKFPETHVQSTHGMINLPLDTEGKWLVLFSHPADFTPVCTTEIVAFAKRYDEFKKLHTVLIGLSIDQIYSHLKWIEWIKQNIGITVPFPIIADDIGNEAMKLGMIHPGKGSSTVRAVFIVDPHGIIRLISYYPQEIGRQVDEVIRSLKALQVADAEKVSLPENWPNNELIGNKVILPPPKDVQTAESRLKNNEGYDWWFTYKSRN